MISVHIKLLIVFFVFCLLSVAQVGWGRALSIQDTTYYYVSPEGSDDWTGTKPQKASGSPDGPFASPYCAAEAVQNARLSGAKTSLVVQFAAGIYEMDSSWVITEQLSGTANGKTIFRAAPGAEVRLVGGMLIPSSYVQALPKSISGVVPHIRDSLRYIDLAQLGITDPGALENRGFPRPDFPSPVELFIDSRALQMARWPNRGWARIKDTKRGRFGGQFTYGNDRIDQWAATQNLWLHGFWARDWADSYEYVERIDTSNNVIHTREPHGTYGYEEGQRFYAVNLLQELDQAGEWYLNTEQIYLLYWPLPGSEESEIMLSRLRSPILQLKSVRHLHFQNLIFEAVRSHAVTLTNSSDVEFTACTFRNTGRLAVVIQGGKNNAVKKCQIYATGEGGILVSGGMRDSLVNANHRIVNNKIHHTNRWVITYSPGVQLEGVGIVVSHNLFQDIPHMAIRILGNEHIVEYNEFTRIGVETGDAGAIYTGKDWSMRGNVVRYNYFHDINSPYHRGLMGVYLDDLVGGMRVHHNIFQNVQRAVVIGGGRNNLVSHNIFLNCRRVAVRVEYREGTASNASDQLRKRLESVPYKSEPWLRKYPELGTLLEDDPLAPKDNIIQDNVVLNGKWIEIAPKARALQQMKNNRVTKDFSEYPTDTASLDLLFNQTTIQLPDIPWQQIGLQY